MLSAALERVIRSERPRVLGSLLRLTGSLESAEDAFQEALMAAWEQWPNQGVPERPGAWLLTVARRRGVDRLRRSEAERPMEEVEEMESTASSNGDDRLALVFGCCHPAIPVKARVDLALRSICGLTTRQIARARLEPEATTAQRIVRAQRKLGSLKQGFGLPPESERHARLDEVLRVVYLVFNEGYSASEGSSWVRAELAFEGIQLGELLQELLPRDPEVLGLLGLMRIQHARRDARLDSEGVMVPLDEQDRSAWHVAEWERGVAEVEQALGMGSPGTYAIQGAIAALHAQAPSATETDWRQIASLYGLLMVIEPTPIVRLNACIALGMAHDPRRALSLLHKLEQEGELKGYPYLPAAKGEFHRRLGEFERARVELAIAAKRARTEPERRLLERRIRALK